MKKDGIAVHGHYGTWHVIDEILYSGRKYYLLEHEEYGEEAAALIVNAKGGIEEEEVYNGFDDLYERREG